MPHPPPPTPTINSSQTTIAAAPVVRFAGPEALESAFASAGFSLALSAADPPLSESKIVEACKLAMDWSVRSGSPRFFNQLYGRAELVSIVGDWVATAVNANVHTFEVAPLFTLMEQHCIARLARAVGTGFEQNHEGIFVPGGSMGNLYAMNLARHRICPELLRRGASGGPKLIAFVSAEAHYSYLKSARLLGIGADNLISVPVDAAGGMRATALREAIRDARADGGVPFFVGATSGSTVRGAFDPLVALAAVCSDERDAHVGAPALWLHVDAGQSFYTSFPPM